MNFAQAMQDVLGGFRVRRAKHGVVVQKTRDDIAGDTIVESRAIKLGVQLFAPTQEDMLAEDWQRVPEQP